MCRLFGFRSVIPSQVHRSLLSAENALVWQSERHPDGWGVAYFVGGIPHLIKSAETAIQDSLFRRVSGIVSSHTVVAHLRKATKGTNSLINSHPFQYGSWVFAHNGDISNFEEYRGELVAQVHPALRRFILGDTDSEVFFYLLLGNLSQRLGQAGKTLHQNTVEPSEIMGAIEDTIAEIEETVGLKCYEPEDPDKRLLLSFVLTNGTTMVAHQGGKDLFYSTHKVCCPERDSCPSFAKSCENTSGSGDIVNHMIFSSEELSGENVWQAMMPGQIIGVDRKMRLFDSRGATPIERAPEPAAVPTSSKRI